MDIYLDIDGVLITKDGNPANSVNEFLQYTVNNHNVYWLTTHCRTGGNNAVSYLQNKLPQKTVELIKVIKPTNWNTLKTEALVFSQDFLWLDDYIMNAEIDVLEKNNCAKNFVRVDLVKSPNQLIDIINKLKSTNLQQSD